MDLYSRRDHENVSDHVVPDFASGGGVRGVDNGAEFRGEGLALVGIVMVSGAMAVFVKKLVEEQLSEVVVAQVDGYEDSSETLGGVPLEVLWSVMHVFREGGVPLIHFL